MADIRLVLIVPQGAVVATSLGIEGFARHTSPGSGKYFFGRTVLFDLAFEGDRPAFSYMDEGGWRDTTGDTIAALQAARAGKRTKTALSNNAFSCTPITWGKNGVRSCNHTFYLIWYFHGETFTN